MMRTLGELRGSEIAPRAQIMEAAIASCSRVSASTVSLASSPMGIRGTNAPDTKAAGAAA